LYNSVIPLAGGPPFPAAKATCGAEPIFWLPPDSLPVFKVPPVAQAPAVVAASPFKTLEVVLYQTCPSTGLDGSDATASICVPFISLYVAIINLYLLF